MPLPVNSCLWIHNYENKYEFLIMNSLWRISWNHCWILINEFTYEIMAEFLNLNSISISYELIMWSGKVLVSVLEIMNLSLKSTHCQQEWPSTEPAQQVLLGGDRRRRAAALKAESKCYPKKMTWGFEMCPLSTSGENHSGPQLNLAGSLSTAAFLDRSMILFTSDFM